ncbi:hypothetical protein [Nonomuraea guangzhouensis]|uniref:Pentapeptide repeat-containing protein n=1 Tax=Nonomuraea guangzhouensis TaxID=1291555 RepID=A0ABW4GL52_9ACTN|nr:hypothetical protein [Nonomuraea guangzhouensis]
MELERQHFSDTRVIGSGRTIGPARLDRCQFVNCSLVQRDDPEYGLVVRDIVASRCALRGSVVQGVRFEDVLVERLTTTGMIHLEACVFRHVTLRGPMNSMMTIPPAPFWPDESQAAFTASAVAFYRDVDWALDISQAEFAEADFYWVPGELVRRDPATQLLLRRSSFDGVDHASLPLDAQIAAERFESTPFDTVVAIAPTRSKHFAERLAALNELRRRGLAE